MASLVHHSASTPAPKASPSAATASAGTTVSPGAASSHQKAAPTLSDAGLGATANVSFLKTHFEKSGTAFIASPIPDDVFLRAAHWTTLHSSGAARQSKKFFEKGQKKTNSDKAAAAPYDLENEDGSPFGPCIFAVGVTIFFVPDNVPEGMKVGIILDRNHVDGSTFKVLVPDNGCHRASTGQHLVGDITMQMHQSTFASLPMQAPEKTVKRFQDQQPHIETIHKNLTAFGQELGLEDIDGVPALVHSYTAHTKDGTAGELLAAAITTTGRLVFISNKQAARTPRGRPDAVNRNILTAWGGKPDAVVSGPNRVRVESIYEAGRREGIEEAGIDVGSFMDQHLKGPVTYITIGNDSEGEPIQTPAAVNLRPAEAVINKK